MPLSTPTIAPSPVPTPLPSPGASPPLSSIPTSSLTSEPTPSFREESPDELKQALSPTPEPTPSLLPSTLPDLTPPPSGWIAFRTPEGRLALISPDASRFILLTEQGEGISFVWSPDGRWLAFIISLGSYAEQLALISMESSCLIPLTRPGEVEPGDVAWSQDSRSLAYFYKIYKINYEKERKRSPEALRLLDLSTHQVITLTTYSNIKAYDSAHLCPQAFLSPLLAVKTGCCPTGSLQIWDTRSGKMVVELGWVHACYYRWLPEGRGVIFTQVMDEILWGRLGPVNLALWTVGEEAPVVVLEGTEERDYWLAHWLPDGRLVVKVTRWESENELPDVEAYRVFSVEEEGIREVEGSDLPWWAAGGLQERLAVAQLPQAISGLSGWEVGPDGEAVIFTWRWGEDEERKSAIYLWRGEGEPMRLSMGEYAQWQPKVPPFSPTPAPP